MQNQDRVARRCDHGLPMRGNSHLIICRYGSPLDGIRSIAFLAKGLACSSVCRLSLGSDIHSRMILRRAPRQREHADEVVKSPQAHFV